MQSNTIHTFPVLKNRILQFSSFNNQYSKSIEIHDNDHCRWSSIAFKASFSRYLENIIHQCEITVTMVRSCNHLELLTRCSVNQLLIAQTSV